MRTPLLTMFPLMRHSTVSWPVSLLATRRTAFRRSPARQSQGATKSPRQSPRRAALADAFFRHILPGEPPVGERPSLRNHPGVEIAAAEPAHCHAPVTTPVAFLAGNRPAVDPVAECASRALAAPPTFTTGETGLGALRHVDAMETHTGTAHLDGVASITDARPDTSAWRAAD